MEHELYELIIVGGGPAGCSAAVYAARKKLKTALITDVFGGQSTVSETIYNWIGTPEISGSDLAKNLEQHVRYYESALSIHSGHRVVSIENNSNVFTVTITDNAGATQTFMSKSVLYTLGSGRRKLTAPGADLFEHKGLTYCASCDGPLFSGSDVAVIGGGNAAFESALQLLAYCNSVTLIHRSDSFRADALTVESAQKFPNFHTIINANITEITGATFVNGIHYTTSDSPDEIKSLAVSGIFVEIGQIPNTDPVSKLVKLDAYAKIITDPERGTTSVPGLWAAGDCTNCLYHQNNIAAGDAVRALEDLYIWVQKQK